MNDLIAEAKAQIAFHEKEAEELRAFVRKANELIAKRGGVVVATTGSVQRQPSSAPLVFEGTAKPKSKREEIRIAVRALLAIHGALQARIIVSHLLAANIDLESDTDEKRVALVSSALNSAKNEFVSDRRIGWSLAKKNPNDGGTSSGFGEGQMPLVSVTPP